MEWLRDTGQAWVCLVGSQCWGSLQFSCTVEYGLHHVTVPSTICSQVCNKIIFLMSFVGNCGTFTRGYRAMILDVEFLYHLLYLLICAMGLFVHEFFYSLLVSSRCSHISHMENRVNSYHRPHLLTAPTVPGPRIWEKNDIGNKAAPGNLTVHNPIMSCVRHICSFHSWKSCPCGSDVFYVCVYFSDSGSTIIYCPLGSVSQCKPK